ncbi:Hpt domain-containing protein [Mucilaginibacter auburnensis]|uniref:Hpt domain-containing protein n=1 Tax=Mucilaginibacter auburnensis TaxID=1457233 RepID=A0A2H9VUQ0_9SPHI|nr:Hpt domain-containing protein [Mucilaginibacter auburnensis]PJJ84528.1 Hpt domain-containing protein [Mucilaginibacter auburnensis]
MPEIQPGPDLDLSLLNEIADGSTEFIVDSIDMFLQQTPESIQQVDDAMNAKDWATAGSAAHKMKSTLGFFGMLESQALVQQVELSCKKGAPDEAEVRGTFNQVKDNIAQNIEKLLKFKEEAGV